VLGTVRWTAVCREDRENVYGFVWVYIVTQFIYKLEEGVERCRVQFFITKYVFKHIFHWHLLYYYTFVHGHILLSKLPLVFSFKRLC